MNDSTTGHVGRLARLPSSRVTKWLVVAFWLVVVGLLAGPAGKLQGVLNNEAASWLPEDGKSLQVIVPVDAGPGGWDALGTTGDQMRAVAASDTPAGLSMHVTGPVGYAADSSEAFSGLDGKLLYSAMAVVIL